MVVLGQPGLHEPDRPGQIEDARAKVEPLQARFAATYDFGDRQETVEFVRPLIGTHPQTGRRPPKEKRALRAVSVDAPSIAVPGRQDAAALA